MRTRLNRLIFFWERHKKPSEPIIFNHKGRNYGSDHVAPNRFSSHLDSLSGTCRCIFLHSLILLLLFLMVKFCTKGDFNGFSYSNLYGLDYYKHSNHFLDQHLDHCTK